MSSVAFANALGDSGNWTDSCPFAFWRIHGNA